MGSVAVHREYGEKRFFRALSVFEREGRDFPNLSR